MQGDIYHRIEKYGVDNQLWKKGDGIVVGVSGGADSVFLLATLKRLQETYDFLLHVVHVHHGIRGEEADRDMEYTKDLAKHFGVSYRGFLADIPQMAKEQHMTEEEAGRVFRYECFEKERQRLGYTSIAVAHHADDQAETVLFQILRGSGIRGLRGMLPKKEKIIRPLLEVSRQEIEKALADIPLEYCMDKTNQDIRYARNALRQEILPTIEQKIQPQAKAHLAALGRHMRGVAAYIEEQAELAYQNVAREEEDCVIFQQKAFQTMPLLMQQEVILKGMETLAGKRKDFTAKHVDSIRKLVQQEGNGRLDLPYGIRVEVSYEVFSLRCESIRSKCCSGAEIGKLSLSQSQTISLSDGKKLSIFSTMEKGETFLHKDLKKHCTKCFDYDKMNFMPIFRYPKEGDFFWLQKDGKKKKLSRYFIDQKIPKNDRKKIPVLAAGSHIVWIPELDRCSAYYYVSEETQNVLQIQIL